MVTYKEVRENEDIKTYIKMADQTLANMHFTEHSFAHVVRCAGCGSSYWRWSRHPGSYP